MILYAVLALLTVEAPLPMPRCVRPDASFYIAKKGACRPGEFLGFPCKHREGQRYWAHSWEDCSARRGTPDTKFR